MDTFILEPPMERRKLIRLVKPHTFLYDPSDEHYKDFYKKKVTWLKIGKEMGYSAEECKIEWTKVKEGYRKMLIRKRKNIEQGLSHANKKLKFEDDINFIESFFKGKLLNHKDQSDLNSEMSNTPITDKLHSSTSQDSPGEKLKVSKNDNNLNIETIWMNEFENNSHPHDDEKDNTQDKSSYDNDNTRDKSNNDNDDTQDKSNNDNNDTQDKSNNDNDIDLFFTSIAITVKMFSKYNQAMAKARVFSIISELELEELNDESNKKRHL